MRRFSLTCLVTFRHDYGHWTTRTYENGWIRKFRHCRRCNTAQSEWSPPASRGYKW